MKEGGGSNIFEISNEKEKEENRNYKERKRERRKGINGGEDVRIKWRNIKKK